MSALDPDLYRRLLESSPEGAVLVDAEQPDQPVIYVNSAFESLSGYGAADLLGRNLRLLQGEDREQEGRHRLRECLSRGEPCRALMRNYRKRGDLFWNEITIVPLADSAGRVTHFAGYHRDAGDRLLAKPRPSRDAASGAGAPGAARDDRLTGLFTLSHLEDLLKRDWAIAQRERRSIAAFSIDLDALDLYNATFGRAAGDSAIRRVAHCISGCLRRASDATARVDGGTLVAFAPGLDLEEALRLGRIMAERVRELRIHHPRCAILRYVSVSIGVSSLIPDAADTPANLLRQAGLQMKVAKNAGRNRAA